jgi:hypothetical protein
MPSIEVISSNKGKAMLVLDSYVYLLVCGKGYEEQKNKSRINTDFFS